MDEAHGSRPVAKRHARSEGIRAACALIPLRRARRSDWEWDPAATGFVLRPRRSVYVRRSIRHLLRHAPSRLRRAMPVRRSGAGSTPRIGGRGGTLGRSAAPAKADMGPEPRKARGPILAARARHRHGHAVASRKKEGHEVHPWLDPAGRPGGADGTGLAGAACHPHRRGAPGVVLRCGGTGRALRWAGHAGAATRGTVHGLLACGCIGRVGVSGCYPRASEAVNPEDLRSLPPPPHPLFRPPARADRRRGGWWPPSPRPPRAARIRGRRWTRARPRRPSPSPEPRR